MADSPRLTRAKRDEHTERDKRLARALRENLRRRKQQARSKAQRAAEPGGDSLGLLQVAIEHRQRVAGIFPQPGILPSPRFGLEQLDRFLMVLDLVGDELPIEIGPELRGELTRRRWRRCRHHLQAALEPPKPSIGLAMIGDDTGAERPDRRGCCPSAGELAELDLAAGAERGAVDEILIPAERRRGRGGRRSGGLLLRTGAKDKESKRRHDNRDRQTRHGRPSIVSRISRETRWLSFSSGTTARRSAACHWAGRRVIPILRSKRPEAAVAQW